jgi:hypothetical protein
MVKWGRIQNVWNKYRPNQCCGRVNNLYLNHWRCFYIFHIFSVKSNIKGIPISRNSFNSFISGVVKTGFYWNVVLVLWDYGMSYVTLTNWNEIQWTKYVEYVSVKLRSQAKTKRYHIYVPCILCRPTSAFTPAEVKLLFPKLSLKIHSADSVVQYSRRRTTPFYCARRVGVWYVTKGGGAGGIII